MSPWTCTYLPRYGKLSWTLTMVSHNGSQYIACLYVKHEPRPRKLLSCKGRHCHVLEASYNVITDVPYLEDVFTMSTEIVTIAKLTCVEAS
jgi:hypothetical protein